MRNNFRADTSRHFTLCTVLISSAYQIFWIPREKGFNVA